MSHPDDLSIRPLGDEDTEAAARILQQMNAELELPEIIKRFKSMRQDHAHYFCLGAYSGDSLCGVCGYWVAERIWCGKYIEIDNLVIDESYQNLGIGARFIEEVEGIGREHDCLVITLDSYTSNRSSHRFYHRLGYEIYGFHFVKPLKK